MSIWDDPEVQVNDDYVRWETPGDAVTGTVVFITKHTFPDGKVAPQLNIEDADGNVRILTAGQMQLKAKLGELRPEVGDTIYVKFERTEKRDGGKTLKVFDVRVKKGDEQPAKAAASTAEPPF